MFRSPQPLFHTSCIQSKPGAALCTQPVQVGISAPNYRLTQPSLPPCVRSPPRPTVGQSTRPTDRDQLHCLIAPRPTSVRHSGGRRGSSSARRRSVGPRCTWPPPPRAVSLSCKSPVISPRRSRDRKSKFTLSKDARQLWSHRTDCGRGWKPSASSTIHSGGPFPPSLLERPIH